MLASGDYLGNIGVWDTRDGNEWSRTSSQTITGEPYLAFSTDGKTVVSGHLDGAIRVWQLTGALP